MLYLRHIWHRLLRLLLHKHIIAPFAFSDTSIGMRRLSTAVFSIVVPHSFMLAAIGVPHDAMTYAICTLELSFIYVAVEELPDAACESTSIEMTEIDFTIASCVNSDSVTLMIFPHAIENGAGSVADFAHSIHDVIEEPAFLDFRDQLSSTASLFELRSPQNLPLVVA